jgi:hypothetical protein
MAAGFFSLPQDALFSTPAVHNFWKFLHRSLDVLHVATALHLGEREFPTFDTNQANSPPPKS